MVFSFITFNITGLLLAVAAPSYDDKGSSFFNYEPQARSWRRVPKLVTSKRASASILHMDAIMSLGLGVKTGLGLGVARQVCTNAGSDAIMSGDGAGQILNILRVYPLLREVGRFS